MYGLLIGKRVRIETEGTMLNVFKIISITPYANDKNKYVCHTECKHPHNGYNGATKLFSERVLNNLIRYGISSPPKNNKFRRPITYRLEK